MKNVIIKAAIIFVIAPSCDNQGSKTTAQQATVDSSKAAASEQAAAPSISGIVSSYLQLKNAFAKDNSSSAAAAAASVKTAFESFNKKGLSEGQQKQFDDIQAEAIEHTEHISKNGGNIEHQRGHFETLSDDMYDLVKIFGAGQTLYKDFCPMYNKGKGASWISETKEIKNPYMGKAMSTCGIVKEEIK